jgi:hypothetical protein
MYEQYFWNFLSIFPHIFPSGNRQNPKFCPDFLPNRAPSYTQYLCVCVADLCTKGSCKITVLRTFPVSHLAIIVSWTSSRLRLTGDVEWHRVPAARTPSVYATLQYDGRRVPNNRQHVALVPQYTKYRLEPLIFLYHISAINSHRQYSKPSVV